MYLTYYPPLFSTMKLTKCHRKSKRKSSTVSAYYSEQKATQSHDNQHTRAIISADHTDQDDHNTPRISPCRIDKFQSHRRWLFIGGPQSDSFTVQPGHLNPTREQVMGP